MTTTTTTEDRETLYLRETLESCKLILAHFNGVLEGVEGGDEEAIDLRERIKGAIADTKERIRELEEELNAPAAKGLTGTA